MRKKIESSFPDPVSKEKIAGKRISPRFFDYFCFYVRQIESITVTPIC
jgi:hypothetical protein